jgi:CheY-like chemotaxis protein
LGYVRAVPPTLGYVWTEQPPKPPPLRVLVIDDERDTVLSLMTLLNTEGCEAAGAYDGHSALRELESFDPDVVIVDIAMPGMTGWDIAREIRSKHRYRPTLIAISGAYVKTPDEMLARVAGFNHFFAKPCDPKRLLQILSITPRITPSAGSPSAR